VSAHGGVEVGQGGRVVARRASKGGSTRGLDVSRADVSRKREKRCNWRASHARIAPVYAGHAARCRGVAGALVRRTRCARATGRAKRLSCTPKRAQKPRGSSADTALGAATQTATGGAHFFDRSHRPPPYVVLRRIDAVDTLVALGWRIFLMACTRLSVAQPSSGAAPCRSLAAPPRALPAPRRRRCGRCGASRVTAATLSSAQRTEEGASELAYGAALVQGKRDEQEDAFTVLPNVAGGYLYAGACARLGSAALPAKAQG